MILPGLVGYAAAMYHIYGALGSPYSMKMRGIARYRRLPHLFHTATGGQGPIADVKPRVIPVIEFPDGSMHVDSTPMIDALEERHPGDRSIVPRDPVHAFLAFLLEDFADEWVTKMMFHFRWYREIDQVSFAREGTFDRLGPAGREALDEMARMFRQRQVGRMPLVGCTEQNRPLIESTFAELVRIFDDHVVEQRFLFGSRPSRADFGFYGQFTQLVNDPTPSERMRGIAPFAWRWVHHLDDAAALEGEWLEGDDPLPEGVIALLRMCGEVYLPFLLANARAFERGEETLTMQVRGCDYSQGTFKYQVKCLAELRRCFANLDQNARARAEGLLEETGNLSALRG